jgi:Flp pilus assembly pilin Flp
MKVAVRQMVCDRRGVSALEYGLLGAIVATALAFSTPPLAAALAPLYATIASAVAP